MSDYPPPYPQFSFPFPPAPFFSVPGYPQFPFTPPPPPPPGQPGNTFLSFPPPPYPSQTNPQDAYSHYNHPPAKRRAPTRGPPNFQTISPTSTTNPPDSQQVNVPPIIPGLAPATSFRLPENSADPISTDMAQLDPAYLLEDREEGEVSSEEDPVIHSPQAIAEVVPADPTSRSPAIPSSRGLPSARLRSRSRSLPRRWNRNKLDPPSNLPTHDYTPLRRPGNFAAHDYAEDIRYSEADEPNHQFLSSQRVNSTPAHMENAEQKPEFEPMHNITVADYSLNHHAVASATESPPWLFPNADLNTLRRVARKAVLDLFSSKVSYEDFLAEGVDPVVLGKVFQDIGITPKALTHKKAKTPAGTRVEVPVIKPRVQASGDSNMHGNDVKDQTFGLASASMITRETVDPSEQQRKEAELDSKRQAALAAIRGPRNAKPVETTTETSNLGEPVTQTRDTNIVHTAGVSLSKPGTPSLQLPESVAARPQSVPPASNAIRSLATKPTTEAFPTHFNPLPPRPSFVGPVNGISISRDSVLQNNNVSLPANSFSSQRKRPLAMELEIDSPVKPTPAKKFQAETPENLYIDISDHSDTDDEGKPTGRFGTKTNPTPHLHLNRLPSGNIPALQSNSKTPLETPRDSTVNGGTPIRTSELKDMEIEIAKMMAKLKAAEERKQKRLAAITQDASTETFESIQKESEKFADDLIQEAREVIDAATNAKPMASSSAEKKTVIGPKMSQNQSALTNLYSELTDLNPAENLQMKISQLEAQKQLESAHGDEQKSLIRLEKSPERVLVDSRSNIIPAALMSAQQSPIQKSAKIAKLMTSHTPYSIHGREVEDTTLGEPMLLQETAHGNSIGSESEHNAAELAVDIYKDVLAPDKTNANEEDVSMSSSEDEQSMELSTSPSPDRNNYSTDEQQILQVPKKAIIPEQDQEASAVLPPTVQPQHSYPGPANSWTPYISPLRNMKEYKFSPHYLSFVSPATDHGGGYRSLTFNHKIDADKEFCPYELKGACNDQDCRYQHFRDIEMSENDILSNLALPINANSTPEEQTSFRSGLKGVVMKLREQQVKDFPVVAEEIVNFRRSWLKDSWHFLDI